MVSIDFTSEWSEGDLKLVISEEGEEDKVLYANQGTMKIWSPVFRTMLKEGSFKEGSTKEVKMPGKNYADVLELLKMLHPPNSPAASITRKCCALYHSHIVFEFWLTSIYALKVA